MSMKTALIVNSCAGQRKAMAQVESIARTPGEFFELAHTLACRRFDNPLITLRRVRQAKVTADPRVSWALDGEFQPGARQIVLQASPGAVSVIVPQSPGNASFFKSRSV